MYILLSLTFAQEHKVHKYTSHKHTHTHKQTRAQVQDLNREDLIILGLEYSVNDAELKRYFEQFGEVAAAEVGIVYC